MLVTPTTRTKRRRCGSPKENQSTATGNRRNCCRASTTDRCLSKGVRTLWQHGTTRTLTYTTKMRDTIPKGERKKAGRTEQQVSAFVTWHTTRSYFIVAPVNTPSTSRKAHIGKNEPINKQTSPFSNEDTLTVSPGPVLCARPAGNRKARCCGGLWV